MKFYFQLEVYHGINGNMSLDRRDLTLGSDKSSSLSRSEAGTYDVIQAEIQHAKRQDLSAGAAAMANNNGPSAAAAGLTSTTNENEAEAKKRVRIFQIFYNNKQIL